MHVLKLILVTLLINLCFLSEGMGQNNPDNVVTINDIYEAIENGNTPTLIAAWVPDMKWYKSATNFNENEPYTSDNEILNDIFVFFENQWENIVFKNMNIKEIEENVVLATGVLTGRKSKETEAVSIEIHHLWWLKDGRVVKFLE